MNVITESLSTPTGGTANEAMFNPMPASSMMKAETVCAVGCLKSFILLVVFQWLKNAPRVAESRGAVC